MSNVIPLPLPTHPLLMHDGDYVMAEDALTCWITIDKVSVHLVRDKDGVRVYLYPLYDEMNNEIDSAFAPHIKEPA